MSEFFIWLSNNPNATSAFIVIFAILVIALILAYGIAFYQGREISIWSLKIGARPDKVSKPPTTNTGNKSLSEIETLVDIFGTEIKHNYQEMKKWNFEHYEQIANLAINELPIPECREFFRGLAQGSVIVPAKTKYEYGYECFRKAEKSVKTIHTGSMEFWNKDFGKRYFHENVQAIARDIEVYRIFALDDDDIKANLPIILEQERAGVKVLLINPKRLSATSEIMIIDERIVLIDEKTSGDYKHEKIIVNPTEVDGHKKEYNRLINLGRKIGDYQN
jgi:hypothetical protein